jgi:hypothetical protein
LHEGPVSERRLPRLCHRGAGWAWLLTVSMRVCTSA